MIISESQTEVEGGVPYFDVEAWARKTATNDHYFDDAAARRACDFFPKYLRHTKGKWAGKPFILEPWEISIIRTIFGWKRNSDNARRFRIVYIEIGRKNGKTQLAAGVALYMAFCDGEAGAEVYSVANDKGQAGICFNEAARMRKASPSLMERTLAAKESIFNPKYGQAYKILSSDFGNKDGLNSSCIIYDEFHEFKDRALFDVMHTSTGARAQPLEIIITTAGTDKHSICWEQRWHAEQVRDGVITDDEFLPIIYAADKDDDYTDPKVWAKANPNLGKTLRLDYMEKQVEKTKTQPSYLDTFLRYHLNVWVESSQRWLPMDRWNACGPSRDTSLEIIKAGLAEEEERLYGRKCYGGLDLALVHDLSALALLFPPLSADEKWKVLFRFWCPEDNIKARSKRDRVPYDVWNRFGFIEATAGGTTDFKFIQKQIIDDAVKFDIQEIAFDRMFAKGLVNDLIEEGVDMTEFGQGFLSMAAPTAELERKVIAGDLLHFGHPIARFNAANTIVKRDPAGNIKPDKEKAPDRIDGMVALIMAMGRAIATNGESGGSIDEYFASLAGAA